MPARRNGGVTCLVTYLVALEHNTSFVLALVLGQLSMLDSGETDDTTNVYRTPFFQCARLDHVHFFDSFFQPHPLFP